MEFLTLEAHNFLTLGYSGVLQLSNRGLNLLQGENDDDPSTESNGAGKSSIPDALCWSLFGTTARGESGDAVVNHVAKKNSSVRVVLRDGDSIYEVTRYRKHAEGKNGTTLRLYAPASSYPAGTPVDLSKGTERETQAEIERILGCSYDVFMAAIYAGQEAMPDLPGMTDKHLKLLIEEAAGVQRLERAYRIALTKEGEVKAELEKVCSGIERAQSDRNRSALDLEDAKLKANEFEKGREARAKRFEELAAGELERAQKLVAQLKAKGEDGLKKQLQALQEQIKGIDTQRARADSFRDTTLAAATKQLTAVTTEVEFLAKHAKLLKQQFDNAESQVGKPCNACGKPHTLDDLAQVRRHLADQLRAKVDEAKKARELLNEARLKREQLEAEHFALVKAIPANGALMAQQGELNKQLEEIASLKSDARVGVERVRTMKDNAAAARSEPNPQASLIERTAQRIKELDEHIAALQATREDLMRRQDVAKAVTQVFSPAGVRAHILDTVTPFLNERTAEYLATLSDGNISAVWTTLGRTAKGELREKFSIDVTNDKGARSFKGLSGGEKRKVRLSTMMALQDLVASRATKPLSIWIGDEIDDALDEPGLERLMSILERKAREKGTVVIISHREMRDWVDNVTTVRKTGGLSTVEGSLLAA